MGVIPKHFQYQSPFGGLISKSGASTEQGDPGRELGRPFVAEKHVKTFDCAIRKDRIEDPAFSFEN
jgi:hypothetical protein